MNAAEYLALRAAGFKHDFIWMLLPAAQLKLPIEERRTHDTRFAFAIEDLLGRGDQRTIHRTVETHVQKSALIDTAEGEASACLH